MICHKQTIHYNCISEQVSTYINPERVSQIGNVEQEKKI